MFEQRLQQRLRLLLAGPALVILLIAAVAVTTARAPGVQPREAIFDLYARLAPRPAAPAPRVAIIDIDVESVQRLGPWPWPRTALAELVTAAEGAGASAAVVTVPTEGPDPLSPEIFGRYWLAEGRGEDEAAAILATLPSNDVALAASATGLPTALGVAAALPVTDRPPSWVRTEIGEGAWLDVAGEDGTSFLALPAAALRGGYSALLAAEALPAVTGLAEDPDGVVRRSVLLWSVAGQAAPSAGLAPLAITSEVTAAPARGQLRYGGTPVSALSAGGEILPLDARGEMRLWLPGDLGLPTVSAWRVLTGGEQWTGPLKGRAVYIGQSVTPEAMVATSRGQLPAAAVHAFFGEQIMQGATLERPGWAGIMEGALALVLGALAVAAAIFAAPLLAANLTILLSAILFAGTYFSFRNNGLLLDPSAPVLAMAGGQLSVLAIVVANMLLRDDAVRGAFHGALPPGTMSKLQSRGGGSLLRGTRREVTVLSCALRLPPPVERRFEGRPDDFVRFTASANDALRRTILAHHGTVDFGENGQLLGYWNVPEESPQHIEHACACALKMIDDVNALSENVQTAALSGESAVDAGFAEGVIEIGIASSSCFAGPVGRGARNRYAVIGDAVTLASRLRARSALYGPAIITDDAVYDALRHHYAFLDLDVVRLSEEDGARSVHGLVGNPFLKASKAFRTLADTQRELLIAWKAGDLHAVTLQLQRLRAVPGVPDAYVALFERRLAEARTKSRKGEWQPAELLTL